MKMYKLNSIKSQVASLLTAIAAQTQGERQ